MQILHEELAYMAVHQMFAFNSPVWFNVGLGQEYGKREGDETSWTYKYGPRGKRVGHVDPYLHPQGSACFIIKVDDTIESIWNLMSESARLFKYGSGVGADWSKLRSTKESLSGGGKSQGPFPLCTCRTPPVARSSLEAASERFISVAAHSVHRRCAVRILNPRL